MNTTGPAELGRELREGSGIFLKQRRHILGLTFLSSALLAGIALYQTGIFKKLPQPRWRGFDTERVNGSAEAYSILAVPDGLLGFASYAATACLVGAGPENRSQTNPLLPIAMSLKLLADAAFAGKLTLDECRKIHAFSLWSLLAAGATFAALPLAVGETRAALHHLTGRSA
ncbi:MAG: vitamin K epoxide reductase family protein [Acidobacteriaceae bacterium]|nr:vitamin K epoxide reductase family protein [Acidobacteriaceae bacterium]MBV9227557.1 vitamin K epoxide reductase family protein [Acidobacteriaceae bacterium]MBV9307227.1 vitamin K epoxide reductase family protein [Acidobacteriaceae bacterium]